jgi:predicted tellurium resistance membrane protein TerC
MMETFLLPQTWIALLTLTFLEIVLGIDNIIFISITINRLPQHQHKRARFIGLFLALFFRIALLTTLSYLTKATAPLFALGTLGVSVRDIILFGGGVFLVYKTLKEIWEKVKGAESGHNLKQSASFLGVVLQIIVIDIVFSFDSILTAVGLSKDLPVMIAAVVIAVIIMMLFSGYVSDFIDRYPTLQVLALAFLLLIGVLLILEGFHIEIDKAYVYAALGFSLFVEAINIRIKKVAVINIEEEKEE